MQTMRRMLSVLSMVLALVWMAVPAVAQSCDWTTGFQPPGGMNNPVNALTVFDDGTGLALYAGGTFSTAGGRPSSNIAAWHCAMP